MKFHIIVVLSFILGSVAQYAYPRTAVLWPLLFEFVTPRLASGECCAPSTSNSSCTSYCRILLQLHHNGKVTQLISTPYPIKTMIWDNEEIHISSYLNFEESMEFMIHAVEVQSFSVVDVWIFRVSMDALNGNFIMDHRLGENGNAKISLVMKWACPGYYGINCLRTCPITSLNGYCDSDGSVKCNPPFVDPPGCEKHGYPCDNNPCQNGGTCQLNPENRLDYTCTCSLAYGGKNCESLRCTPESCGNGTCVNGACVCDAGFTGDNCDSVRCENGICQNRGICKVEGGKHVCDCQSENVLGEFCEYRCRPACLYGKCTLNKNKDGAFCECFRGFGGHICDIELGTGGGSGNKLDSSMAVKIAVPIVVIILVAAITGILAYFLYYKRKFSTLKIKPTEGVGEL